MLTQNFFYPLYNSFDKNFFTILEIAVKNKYTFIGDDTDKVFFVKSLLCLQMIKSYREHLRAIKKNLIKKTDLKTINSIV